MENGPMIPLGFFAEIITLQNTESFEEHHFSADWSSEELHAFIRERPNWRIRIQEVLTPHYEADEEPSLADAFDTKLTPYPSTVTLGDQSFTVGEYRMNPNWVKMENKAIYDPTEEGWKRTPVTTADLDTRDHFASEVRALHPTQEDRIETALREVNARLGDDRIELAQRIEATDAKLDDLMIQVNEILRQLDTTGMIHHTIGPIKLDQLPDAKETDADYALCLEYMGGPEDFDPNEYAAIVFERRFDLRMSEDGYYWHRMNVEHEDGPSLSDERYVGTLSPYAQEK
jgi:hypothetical protein